MTPEPVIGFCLLPLMTKSRWPPAARTCGKPGLFYGSLSDIGLACRDPNDDHIVTGDKDCLYRFQHSPCGWFLTRTPPPAL
jgi:hypothetical protein